MPAKSVAPAPGSGGTRRPRGRPRLLSRAEEAALRRKHRDVGSQRGLQDRHFAQRALLLLAPLAVRAQGPTIDGIEWVVDLERRRAGRRRWRKLSVLCELGRIEDAALLVAVARNVGRVRLDARAAALLLRRARLDARRSVSRATASAIEDGRGEDGVRVAQRTARLNEYRRRYLLRE